ncbi:MAG: vWA domain-containing protein [Armatimonadota bacterium]
MNTVVRSLSSAALVFLMSAAVATADTPDTLPPAAEPPASASSPQNVDGAASTPAESKMRSEVVFCIDCSGSMAQSLTRAQEAIAYLVDEMQAKTPDTAIRVGIIRYGTGADPLEINPLTDDPKAIKEYIERLKIAGGAEFVGMFIKNAVERMNWTNDDNVTRQIVMVGNETAFQGPIDYRQAAKTANDRGFTVSAMYCPSLGEELSANRSRYSQAMSLTGTRVVSSGGSRTSGLSGMPRAMRNPMIDVENTWLLTAYFGGGEVMKLSVDPRNPLLRLGPAQVANLVEEIIPAQEARIAQVDAAFAAYDMGVRPGAAPRGTGGPARITPGAGVRRR